MTPLTTPAGPATDVRTDPGSPGYGGIVEPADVVDHLLGVRPGDRLDQIRAARPEARANAQKAYEALFHPVDDSQISVAERLAVATFVVGLHGSEDLRDYYATRLAAVGGGSGYVVVGAVDEEVARARGNGPYGIYREPGLAPESRPGPSFEAAAEAVLGGRLSAALEHAQLLVLRPREATPEALDRLLTKGWSTTGIVTLSQLVAFLAFQVRVVHGLRQLAAAGSEGAR
ncbi:CMD domain protein [Georgenia soli]|uniref:CMD domain protein n=1 Tax=Georgenia soli TaxID=638953 RepID=UPI000BFAAA10|nr:CMD domain protein [Georgenia soli]